MFHMAVSSVTLLIDWNIIFFVQVKKLYVSLMHGFKGKFHEDPLLKLHDSYSCVILDGNSNPELHL